MADRTSTQGKTILLGMLLKISSVYLLSFIIAFKILTSFGFKDPISFRLLMQYHCSQGSRRKGDLSHSTLIRQILALKLSYSSNSW